MKSLFNIFHTLFWRGYIIASVFILFLVDCLFFRNNYRAIKAAERLCNSLILAVGGVKVEVNGMENIPSQTVIFMSNHQSDLDWPVLISVLPGDIVFLAKKELFEVPLFGQHLRLAGHLLIDRSSAIRSQRSLDEVAKVVREGRSIVIFPEGTRTPTGKLGEFGLASFTVVKNSGVPVVPIVIDGTYKALRKGDPIIHPSHVKVKILKPIMFDKYKTIDNVKEFCSLAASEVRDAISRGLEG
ncbi:MAG: lysophospholipid acyltransferase family protein [Candidatus Saganbacteria bacterium]|nr:lysophospholipid acyltransferase family protein [Candidatus Saganbacteria bacterium]